MVIGGAADSPAVMTVPPLSGVFPRQEGPSARRLSDRDTIALVFPLLRRRDSGGPAASQLAVWTSALSASV